MADEIPAEYLAHMDAAVKLVLDHGLALIIDVRPEVIQGEAYAPR